VVLYLDAVLIDDEDLRDDVEYRLLFSQRGQCRDAVSRPVEGRDRHRQRMGRQWLVNDPYGVGMVSDSRMVATSNHT
jgi:hypothetical protein